MGALHKVLRGCTDDNNDLRLVLDASSLRVSQRNAEDGDVDIRIALVHVDEEHIEVPDLDYACRLVIPSKRWSQAIQSLSVLGDVVRVYA